MAENRTVTFPNVINIDIADICGLWEVIRISRKDDNNTSYPWLNGRLKFNFLEEMLFLCIKDGQNHHGTWELSEKAFETKRRFSIILNGTFEYTVVDIDEDEMTLSVQTTEYLLVRRL